MTRLLIADSQYLVLETLKSVLSDTPGLEVVSAVTDGHELLRSLRKDKVDIVITDTDLPFIGGSTLLRRIREISSEVRIMLITGNTEKELVFSAFRHRVSAYLLRSIELEKLRSAISCVMDGGTIIDPHVATALVTSFSVLTQQKSLILVPQEYVSQLTAGEWKIIHEIEKGLSNREIAENLNLSEGTVRNYITVILDKLRLRDRTQLAIWAVQLSGLLLSL